MNCSGAGGKGWFVTNIYVGNLAYRATEDEIRQAFSRFGQVSRVSIIMDRDTGRSRGFAFVEMPNEDEAKAAVEGLNQQEIAGRRVTINEAKPREDRPRGTRGSGGNYSNSGYGNDRGADSNSGAY